MPKRPAEPKGRGAPAESGGAYRFAITLRAAGGAPVSYRFEQAAVTIGRGASNHLVVHDPSLSRVHAEIRREGDGWVVADRGSRNGTRLNGRRLDGVSRLRPGDEIALGATVLVFELDAAAGEPGTPGRETARLTWSDEAAAEEEPILVGRSAAILAVVAMIDRIGPSDATVLITGENGTGKEVVARLIHARSRRASGPFGVVNCPALPGSLLEAELFGIERGVATGVEPRIGRFESASGGTLLLDEVGDLDPAAQAKILRVLERRTIERVGGRESIAVDVRLLAATNHDLDADIDAGTFRRDLFHRLHVLAVHLPPLRERAEDIPPLADHFLSRPGGPAVTVGVEALGLLRRYDYPGNVRELAHILERARVLADGPEIRPADLPDTVRRDGPAASGPAGADPVEILYQRIVVRGEPFWQVLQRPFLRREISREDVRRFVERVHRQAGGSYKEMARLCRIPAEHKKLLNFLRNHGLGVDS